MICGISRFNLNEGLHDFQLTCTFFSIKGIQITATTPSSTAIRLHTGIVALELSNRSPNKEKKLKIPKRMYLFIIWFSTIF